MVPLFLVTLIFRRTMWIPRYNKERRITYLTFISDRRRCHVWKEVYVSHLRQRPPFFSSVSSSCFLCLFFFPPLSFPSFFFLFLFSFFPSPPFLLFSPTNTLTLLYVVQKLHIGLISDVSTSFPLLGLCDIVLYFCKYTVLCDILKWEKTPSFNL